ncbi:MAG TPA: hypothetical protein VFE15_11095 [Marmoricola sp.]|jgi:hypothetical protein|nr:hypothetical protein [Marmoricola sp.]
MNGGLDETVEEPEPAPKPRRRKTEDGQEAARKLGITTGAELPTHKDLEDRLRRLGGAAVKVSSAPVMALPPLAGHNEDFVRSLDEDPEGTLALWDSVYRNKTMRDMDEIVATSAIREFIIGYIEAMPESHEERVNGRALIANVSKISRFPTAVIGYSTATGSMQHPTSSKTHVFTKPSGSNHYYLDVERKLISLEAGETELAKQGATKETILNAMLREAAIFTLNFMAAPASASDIHPFGAQTKLKGELDDQILEWVWAREKIKHLAIRLGAREEPAPADEDARGRLLHPWQDLNKDTRSVSPARVRKKGNTVKLLKIPSASPAGGPLATAPAEAFPPRKPAPPDDFPPPQQENKAAEFGQQAHGPDPFGDV